MICRKGEPANLNKFTLLPSNGEKIQKDNSLRRNQSMRNMANGGFMTSQKNGVKRSGSCRVRLNQQEEGGSVQERRQRLMNNFMKNAPEEVQRKQKVEEKREENVCFLAISYSIIYAIISIKNKQIKSHTKF